MNSSGGYTQTSDLRLKKDLTPLASAEALEKITSLNAFTYHWKDKSKLGSEKQIGLIAQEVEKVFPEATKRNQEGYLSVSYSNLVAPVIEAIKELFNQSQKQERSIASVKAETTTLQVKVEKLEGENKALKQYLCSKDPQAPFCKK